MKIIIINGCSSSGKTSLSRELQYQLKDTYLHISSDQFLGQFPYKLYESGDKKIIGETIDKGISNLNHCAYALAKASNNIIIDCVFERKEWQIELFSLLNDFDTTFVGLKCDLEELEKREKKRGDRAIGLARAQFNQVHRDMHYDIELDSNKLAVVDCAKEIIGKLK